MDKIEAFIRAGNYSGISIQNIVNFDSYIISCLIVAAVLIILSSLAHVTIGMYKLYRDIRKKGIDPKLFSRMMKQWIDLDIRVMISYLSALFSGFLWMCIMPNIIRMNILPNIELAAFIAGLPFILLWLFYLQRFRCPCCNKKFVPWWACSRSGISRNNCYYCGQQRWKVIHNIEKT